MDKKMLEQELLEIQEHLRSNGEYSKAKTLEHVEKYIKASPDFLRLKKTTNPDTGRTLELVDKRECVAVLVTNCYLNKILLVRQFRAGCINHIHEVVAGVVEEDQDPLDAVFAELRQEVGIQKKDIDVLANVGSYYSSVGWTNEIAHLYFIQLKKDFTQLEQELDEEECLSYAWIDAHKFDSLYKGGPVPIKTAMLYEYFKSIK